MAVHNCTQRFGTLPEYPLEEYARMYPFRYSDEDLPNLVRALAHHYPDESVSKWVLQFLDPSDATDTMKLLTAMTHGIRNQFTYARRIEKGVQTPEETLQSQKGNCRDFAVLMIEGARSLGNLIRVAVAWAPEQVLPLWGTYEGPPRSFLGMDVTVTVSEAADCL